MDTGSFSTENHGVFRHIPRGTSFYKFTAATDLKEGEEVYISGDMTVSGRSGALAQFPLGHSTMNVTAGDDVNVILMHTCAIRDAVAGAVITAGNFIVQDVPANFGATGKPQYLVAASGNYTQAIALKGGAIGAPINVAIITVPILIP